MGGVPAALILANPGETLEEMQDTMRLNSKLMPNGLKMSLGHPFPGTEYHDIAKEMDLIDVAIHKAPVFTLIKREGKVLRAYWPALGE